MSARVPVRERGPPVGCGDEDMVENEEKSEKIGVEGEGTGLW